MSADNFVVVRKFKDGYRWGNFSASVWWNKEEPYPDDMFNSPPFPTAGEAMQNAVDSLMVIEYGFEVDRQA